MNALFALLPGDGIGPEVIAEAVKVLNAAADKFNHTFEFETALIGGAAIDADGNPFPETTRQLCERADAVLLGAVGGHKWSAPTSPVRPEQGLLSLRETLGLYANLRPVKLFPQLLFASTIKPETLKHVDLLVVRELTGGVYFGKREEGDDTAYDTMIYHRHEIERVVRAAANAARQRKRKLTSVDKANVLASSRLWRKVVSEVIAKEFPDIELEHMLVDAMAMYLIRKPSVFDVVVTENMFGDILTDEASMLAGSMGMLPSASIGDKRNRYDCPFGVYEPIHGSAPDIAGKGIANPIATILSAGMALRMSFNLIKEADAIEAAVNAALDNGWRAEDIQEEGKQTVGTSALGSFIADAL